MKNITFKKGTLEDVGTLQAIAYKTFKDAFGSMNTKENMNQYLSEAFTEAKIKEEVSNENSFFYLVTNEEKVIGYLKLNIGAAQSEAIEDGLEIERIYLLATYQGLGIGQLMMDKTFEIALSKHKSKLWLGVWNQNKGAIRFYQRNGFRKFAEHSFWLGTEQQTDFLMEVILDNG